LPHAVENDHGVVHRITDNRQQGGNGGEIELQLQNAEYSDRRHHVVHQRNDGAERELPLEPEPDVDQHQGNGDDDGENTILYQFAADLRADDLDAAVFDRVAEFGLDRVDDALRGFLIVIAGRLDTDQDIVCLAKLLNLNFAEAEPAEVRAQLADVGRAVGRYL